MASLSPQLQDLLADAPELPLTQRGLRPGRQLRLLASQTPDTLFPGAKNADAAYAGLLLRLGCWAESHENAQDISSVEGSYWHAIIHRMEPDAGNAAYWFRRVGRHAIFPELLSEAQQILARGAPRNWRLKAQWDPLLFIEWCEEAQTQGGGAESAARAIQMAEWQLLFDWCAAPA